MRSLVWLRSDLRTTDNTALAAAARATPESIALFVISPADWTRHDVAPARVDLVLRSLAELSTSLSALGIPLLIEHARSTASVPALVLETAASHACTQVHFNREYEVDESRRDEVLSELAAKRGISVHAHHDQSIVPPGAIRTGEGRPYTIFTPFKKTWIKHLIERGIPALHTQPTPRRTVNVRSSIPPISVDGFVSSIPAAIWGAGESEAVRRLEAFARTTIKDYKISRDLPALHGTSTLSPYLTIGAISPRQCLHAALAATKDPARLLAGDTGPATWISELIWRDFYIHILAAFPRVCMGRAFQPATEHVAWRTSEADLSAWKQGRTGIPIVDAGMRQLLATGWMHNRVRMITAMFLAKNLLIDWREGERHFMRHLVDGFFTSNNGGWQWAASTGTDAAPYFRVFNPVSQSQRFDARGEYVRRYVQELADLDDDAIHEPWTLPDLARARLDYPAPIVDLSSSRERAIAAFRSLRA